MMQQVAPDYLSARNTQERPAALEVAGGTTRLENGVMRVAMPSWSVGIVAPDWRGSRDE